MTHHHDLAKHVGDLGSIGVNFATIANWLPSVATMLSIIWFALRIWESDTVRELTGRVKPPQD